MKAEKVIKQVIRIGERWKERWTGTLKAEMS